MTYSFDKRRLPGAMRLLWDDDDFMQMKWNLFGVNYSPKNIQDERCPPSAVHRGPAKRSGVRVSMVRLQLHGAAEVLKLAAVVQVQVKGRMWA